MSLKWEEFSVLFATLKDDLRTKVLHIIHMTTLDTNATVQATQASRTTPLSKCPMFKHYYVAALHLRATSLVS